MRSFRSLRAVCGPGCAAALACAVHGAGAQALPQQVDRMNSYEQTLRAQPRDAAACAGERQAAIAAALAARAAGNTEQALSLLLRAQQWLGQDPLLLRDTGILEEQMKLYKDAHAALSAAHEAAPQDPVTLYALARVEMDLGQTDVSSADWRTYLAMKPEDASAHYAYGLLLEQANQPAQAGAEFQQSIRIQPVQVESYYRLGEIRREQGDPAGAAQLYTQALASNPRHAGALTGLGMLAFAARHYADADHYLEQAIDAAPSFETAQYYHALTLAKLGDTTQAAAELQLSVTLANRQNLASASASRQLLANR